MSEIERRRGILEYLPKSFRLLYEFALEQGLLGEERKPEKEGIGEERASLPRLNLQPSSSPEG